jgi:hypothetical protein
MAGIAPVMKHDEEERAMTRMELMTESEIVDAKLGAFHPLRLHDQIA